MRTYLMAIAMMVACQSTFAQSTKTLFKEFGQEENAESLNISPLLMGFARLFTDDEKIDHITNKITSLKILDLDECSEEVKQRFHKKVNKMNLAGYETLARVNSDGEKVKVLMKVEDDAVRELLIVCTGNDCAMIQFNGKIAKDKIAALVDRETNKRKNGRE